MQGSWPAGGGEMGALMRATDWARTRLGPVDGWPRSLKTMLGVVLGSRFPMLLWWGPDLLHLYNDAYRPILRDKHPASLAAPAAEVWAEVWEVAGPMAQGVMEGGPATWTEDLQLFIHSGGIAEETYFTFSYSPVPGDDGRVGGILNTVQETTAKVRGERQIRILHDLTTRAGGARSEAEAFRLAAEVLAADELDLPFVDFYAVDEAAGDARRVASGGWAGYQGPARPARVPLAADPGGGGWPLAEAARTGREVLVADLAGRFGDLPVGRWGGRPGAALVLPLPRPDRPGPLGFLVAGASPHRGLDDGYRQFLRAAADQVVAALAGVRAYEAERKRTEALAEVDRAKTTFFSNVSHELRTPLTLMLGPVEDALAGPGRSLAGESLALVHRNTLRLTKLVNALLAFARAESGRARAAYEPTDLAALTADLAGAFRSAVEAAGLRFEVDCRPLPEPIYVDPDMWERIVLNLLSNALKFTFEGAVGIGIRASGDHAELEVRDTGTGIPAAELPRLFERFHRVPGARSRSHEGSGIGLALVRQLVELHGGSVRVASRPGEGTTFTVALPRGAAHLPADQVVAARSGPWAPRGAAPFVDEAHRWSDGGAPAPGPGDAAPVSGGHVLVVDDNPDLRGYIRASLAGRYDVEVAGDGLAALEAARRRRPWLIVSDVMMPRLDGFGLLRELRADPGLRDVPLVLLSARAGEESVLEGLEAGADDYLAKPFSARELLARVKTHFEASRQREMFERFFTLSVDLMCIAGPDGCFQRVSPAFGGLGHRPEELASRPVLDFVHPEDLEATRAEIGKLALGERTLRFENRYRCRDGSYRRLAWSMARDAFGARYAIARDVTEARRIQEALAEAMEAARAANRELESFSYSVAHDLRAPLRSIDGFSLALLEDWGERLDEAGRGHLARVREAARRMGQLIDDLLALSRVTQSELHRDRVDLSALARGVMARLRASRPDRQVEVAIQEGLACEGDARLLGLALENLLGNAWKFTGKRVRAQVGFGAEPGSSHPVYFVRDDGAGFDMAYAGKLFGAFQRLHPASEFEGTGIGLSIVQRVVARHGGRIWVESAVDRGTTFRFTLVGPPPQR